MEVGIAVDNTIPLHVPTFIRFIRAHSNTLNCHPITAGLRFSGESIDYDSEMALISPVIRQEIQKYDLSLLLTAIQFENNYFYQGRGGTFIISFSDWHLLTTLPMSNGLAYMLCQIITKYVMKIGENHDQNTGCINDFWWDKTGIDVGMRAAFICDRCKEANANNPHLKSQQFSDVTSILNSVSNASRRGVDVLSEIPDAIQASAVNPERFDAFLCHNSQDKALVRTLNQTLKNGGVKTWFDEEQIKPGELWQDKLENQISCIAACLIIVGDSGMGPWQDMERRAFINEFASRGCKVIPVLIGKSAGTPQLPLFLKQFMWSDLRGDDGREVAKIIAALRSS
jgi:TIR domain